jgi:hypothetical protein
MHRYHPDPARDDPQDAILYDNCDRCTEHANDPVFSLSTEYVEMLWKRMLSVELSTDGSYKTSTEARAAKNLWSTYIFLERHIKGINPEDLPFRTT